MYGSVSQLIKNQGINVLLNMFFNPAVNAARGIAYQINSAITQFFTNFYTAVRPQITKYYAQGDMENMIKLIFRSSKFSFYLIMLISMPIVIETPYIINLWLGQLPNYVVPFTRLIVVISAIDSMATPLMTAAHATGHIRLYQSSVGTMTILNLPISYVFLKLGGQPLTVFYISLCISTFCLFMRLWIVRKLMDFPVKQYVIKVFGSCVGICMIALIVPMIAYLFLSENFLNVVVVCSLCIVSTAVSVYGLGLTKHERNLVVDIIRKKILHKY
jgi:O-antigen/teichoic acid export membrane protein